jgi:hypothetical protein
MDDATFQDYTSRKEELGVFAYKAVSRTLLHIEGCEHNLLR